MKSKKDESGFLFAFAVAAASGAVMGNSWHLPWIAEDVGFRLKLVPLSASDLTARQGTQGRNLAVEK